MNRRGRLFLSLCDLCCGLRLGGGGRGGLDNAFLEEPQHGLEVDPRQLPQVRLNYNIQVGNTRQVEKKTSIHFVHTLE